MSIKKCFWAAGVLTVAIVAIVSLKPPTITRLANRLAGYAWVSLSPDDQIAVSVSSDAALDKWQQAGWNRDDCRLYPAPNGYYGVCKGSAVEGGVYVPVKGAIGIIVRGSDQLVAFP